MLRVSAECSHQDLRDRKMFVYRLCHSTMERRVAEEILTLTEIDEEGVFDKIGARFDKVEPGTTLRVRMPLELGVTFLEEMGSTDPTAEGQVVQVSAGFSAFMQQHSHACAKYNLSMFKEREAFLAVLTMKKRPSASLA